MFEAISQQRRALVGARSAPAGASRSAVVSRRSLLRWGSVAAGGATLAGLGLGAAPAALAAEAPLTTLRTRLAPTQAAVAVALVNDPVAHLLRRATFGATPATVAAARALGTAAWLEQQLQPALLPDPVCDALLQRWPTLTMTARQIEAAAPSSGSWWAQRELVDSTLARAAWSERQLLEVMVEFWSNHFHGTTPSSDVWSTKTVDDREVIRPNALGSFTTMLLASAKSPAMLAYLGNALSKASAPNENYGRELLELHTVGIGAGFTEADVKASARALTGWTTDANLLFVFYPDWHATGPLTVLGWSSANTRADGVAVGESYLRYLAAHPATAQHLAHKLCVRFVADAPPAALVQRLAQVYLTSGTQIAPVLRALFASPEFAASTGAKQRRPLEDLVATLRVLNIGPSATGTTGPNQLTWIAEQLSQAPLGWGPPNGYPDVAPAWRSTAGTLGRWNWHLSLANGNWPTELTYPGVRALLIGQPPLTCGDLVDRLSAALVLQTLATRERTAVLGFLGGIESAVPTTDQLTSGLPYLVALILDTPTWRQR